MNPHGWDCHAHVFGPYDDFPLSPDRSYTPPEATQASYLAMLDRLGLEHGVLVHPSAYADDHALLFDALSSHERLRGVIVVRPEYAELPRLHARGIRGARFSQRSGTGTNFAGSASLDDLVAMADALAEARLHAELWTDTKTLPDIADTLRRLPIPVVIDHMGGFDVDAGVDDPGFRTLLSLLEGGHVWLKMCVYRNLPHGADYERGLPFHQALLRANPDRLVWGSDWPHLRVNPAPDTSRLLRLFKDWTADEDLIDRVLVMNPAELYR